MTQTKTKKMTRLQEEQMEAACRKSWSGAGWGFTPEEFIELFYKVVNGQSSNPYDEVYRRDDGMVLNRGMAIRIWSSYEPYRNGFKAAWEQRQEGIESLRECSCTSFGCELRNPRNE